MKDKILTLLVIVALALAGLIAFLLRQNAVLKEEWSTAVNNFKVYELLATSRLDSAKARNYQLEYTKQQLEYSNDSIIQNLNQLRKELKIKDKQLKELQYIGTETHKRDSVFFTDTIFMDGVSVDTTIADEWRVLKLRLNYPSTIDVDTKFTNKLSVVVSAEKQTINPPSKIFFIRWFQRKQILTKIDVVDENPYSTIKEQRFVEIVKNK